MFVASGVLGHAQAVPAAPPKPETRDEQPIQLAAFEVVMTQDKGYHSPHLDGTMTTGFIEYQLNRRWHLKLNVNNVLDETFIVGAQHAAAIDPSQPRTFSLIATLRF